MKRRFAVVAAVFSLLLCLLTLELAARAFWRIRNGVSVFHPSTILYAYYPELRQVDTAPPSHSDHMFDVLLLGASTLHRQYGQIEIELREQLAYRGHRNVQIFDVAWPAQTSRDDWLKYASLDLARFDLVMFYDGFNEARANNAPPEVFRDDYSHYSWYEMLNDLAPYHHTAFFSLPYTLRYLARGIALRFHQERYVPMDSPRNEWLQHGRNIRTARPFEQNLTAILDLAALRGDRILIMTVATYVPDDYSLDAFTKKELGYGLHLMPVETWGRPENVLAAVDAHNRVIRRIAADRKDVLFVDQATLMPRDPRFFNDVCHLTASGSAKFVENLIEPMVRALATGRLRQPAVQMPAAR